MLARLAREPRRAFWPAAGLLALFWFIIYLSTVSPTVNFIDSGELITAAYEPGIAHPPGYPLYVLLGYVASHVLWGEVAWRVNVVSALFGALAIGAFFVLIFQLGDYILAQPRTRSRQAARRPAQPTKGKGQPRRPESTPAAATTAPAIRPEWLLLASAAAGASILGASASFWSRTAQAKMYSLHYFLVAVLFILALGFRRAYERGDAPAQTRWLVALAATLGLSMTNHLMTVLTVVPIALLLFLGPELAGRWRAVVKRLVYAVPAALLPLLLYAYLPVRAGQAPIMNWGSPTTWDDFYRHISGWQFRTYLLSDINGNISRNSELIFGGRTGPGYAVGQWSFLTVLVYLAGIAGAVLLARTNIRVFAVTAAYAAITLIFSLVYGISEIEPYMVPFYAMFAVWLGLAPGALFRYLQARSTPRRQEAPGVDPARIVWASVGAVGALALVSLLLVYPNQNYRENRLAEQFARNTFADLPQNSLLITDYWDFYAPTYYLQLVEKQRPDLVIIDKSLLRYPWYTEQLTRRYPDLMAKSQDIVDTFSREQRNWVDGKAFDVNVLNTSYIELLTSFVERNIDARPAYLMLLIPCDPRLPPEQCENNQIAPTYQRQPAGLVWKLVNGQAANVELPPEPNYNLNGILTNPVPFDTFARENSRMYVDAFTRLAAMYRNAGDEERSNRMLQRASEVNAALQGR
jgi:hypothetical protein